MLNAAKVIVVLSMLWALGALIIQVMMAWGGGRRDYSQRTGSPWRGVLYNFTVAMTPAHKESVRRHPVKFAIGVVMHLGVLLALLGMVVSLAWPAFSGQVLAMARPVTAMALVCGGYLLVRRASVAEMRGLSTPEDFVAILATCGLLALGLWNPLAGAGRLCVLLYVGVFFLYLPLGKLRHAVFFFVARGDYGRRLGYRGVYPPTVVERD
ncbi:MAG: hypothetical protein ABIG44_12040 [Planctomycetota bacterium]